MEERLRRLFEDAGLSYRPHPERVPSSRAALRLTELARDRGKHRPVHDRLMNAYWAEGLDIGDREILRGLATEAGLADDEVERVLAGDEYLGRVQASTEQAQAIGVDGIPAWLLDGRLLVLGAQPRAVFADAFAQLSGRRQTGPD